MVKILSKGFFFFFFFLNTHNKLNNLNISKNISKQCVYPFHGTHVTCYTKFKLLYRFQIVAFFFSFQI